jgi:type III pantothenate kinase
MTGPWLLADIGNSRVKWASARDGKLWPGTPFASEPYGLAERLEQHWGSLETPGAVLASNVAGPGTAAALADWIAWRWAVPLRFATSQSQGQGVVNGYQQPGRLGVDRWLGLIALRRETSSPALLADCGTALTLDLLDAAGRHRGGLIAPGLAPMRRALLAETQGVRPDHESAAVGLGQDTASCVAGGTLWAAVGLIEKAWRQAARELGAEPVLMLSGGDAATLGHALDIPYRLVPDMVLRGLFILAEADPT